MGHVDGKGYRVLVVDDEQKVLQHLDELLSTHGFAVTACQDASRVVSLLKAEPYHVVLMDIRMRGIEGTDLLPLIKKIRPDLPVIIVSAYCDASNADHCRALGAFASIGKPFSHELLLDTVARAIDEEERIPMVLRSLSLREGRDQVYRKLILASLQKTNWNQLRAAELLGVSRFCLMRWMKKLGIAY